ncbi:hypothetical protein [Gelidibacter salicanalis]|uniref:Uncharacterized protein n=1 Tax=Gelidibacter salicanalis TaxID=291193 RepID=A0A934KLM3_9FLAO|nr:hypothetical protein [Gelidibacter salicanalis]MBJ7880024.1 hypothetical protein [Gelidibacter salicanalis]
MANENESRAAKKMIDYILQHQLDYFYNNPEMQKLILEPFLVFSSNNFCITLRPITTNSQNSCFDQ